MALVNAPRDIDGGHLGAEDCLKARATLPADRGHLDDIAILIDRHNRDDTAIGKKTFSSELSASKRISPCWQGICSSSGVSRLSVADGRASRSRLRGQSDGPVILPKCAAARSGCKKTAGSGARRFTYSWLLDLNDVRSGSEADIPAAADLVRFADEQGFYSGT
jgi:hypothetical protein